GPPYPAWTHPLPGQTDAETARHTPNQQDDLHGDAARDVPASQACGRSPACPIVGTVADTIPRVADWSRRPCHASTRIPTKSGAVPPASGETRRCPAGKETPQPAAAHRPATPTQIGGAPPHLREGRASHRQGRSRMVPYHFYCSRGILLTPDPAPRSFVGK